MPIPTAAPIYNEILAFDALQLELNGLEMLCSLNDEQLKAFDAVRDATQQEQKDSKDFFLEQPSSLIGCELCTYRC